MENNIKNYDLTSFKRAHDNMITKNDEFYIGNRWNLRSLEHVKEYSLTEIEKIIQSGSLEEQQKLSRNYFCKNGFYKRLIIYYATLLKYAGILIPNPSFGKSLSTPHINKRYFNAVDFFESLNIPILLTNWAQRALVNGCYYGLLQSVSKNGITVLDLPSDWCRSRFKDTKGNDIIEFNLKYFNTIIDKAEREEALEAYPKIVSSTYHKWEKNKVASSWMFIPEDIGICFPFFDGRPLFLSTIPETLRYDETIEIEQEREADEIRKIIVQKIPHLNDGRLVFEPDEAEEMHSGAVGMLKGNKNISVLTTYADVDAIISKTATENSHNSVEKMMQNIYNKTGTSSELFASTGSSTLESSIENDTALMMILANKFSLFLTNLINKLFENSNINFKCTILPITYYNSNKYVDSSLKMANSGYSLLFPSLSLGLSQRDLVNIKDLENEVLELRDKLIPPRSAYTQSEENSEGGGVEKEDSEKAPKTLENEKSLDKQMGGSN